MTLQPSAAAPTPLEAAAVVGQTPSLKEPRLWCGHSLWLEQRPAEQGRTTLLLRPAGSDSAIELTPAPWNLRSRVHTYGGGVVALGAPRRSPEGTAGADRVADLVVIHDGDRGLWHRLLDPDTGRPLTEPRRLTPAPDAQTGEGPRQGGAGDFADGLIDPRHHRWIGVLEQGGRDQLVAVPLEGGAVRCLHQPADFCGYACLSPDGRHLAWVEWQQPCMPWERSQLWLAEVGADGALRQPRPVAGSRPGEGKGISVFQPLWVGPGSLVVAEDSSGWWNLQQLDLPGSAWRPLLPVEAEFGMPQWVYGMRTTAWNGSALVAARCRQGCWELGRIELNRPGQDRVAGSGGPEGDAAPASPALWQPLEVPFDDFSGLSAEAGRVLAVAASATTPQGLLELTLADGRWRHTPAAPSPLAAAAIQPPQPLWFPGAHGLPTQAWFHPPAGGAGPESPLLVKSHSGPTGMARSGLNLAIQFWTSRGWGVLDVNYGGSTGFGRAYRERLDGQWGVVDVADCAAAARAVVAAGLARADRVAIEGGSAGGFTTLCALCFSDVFHAGASRYGVADPAALAQDSHRFEARYLDGLIGPWPEAAATYRARSPLHHAERLHCPVIFFQGLEDLVVPPEQTERMAAALEAQGIPVEVHRFAGEGHGFRSGAVLIEVLEATEAFFARHFGLRPV